MRQYIESIRKSIEDENWHAALFVALALPGICAKVEDTNTNIGSKEKYISWFQRYLEDEYKSKLDSNFFWELHSSMLLPGRSPDSKANAKFLPVTYHDSPLHNSNVTLTPGESYAHLRIDVFCEDVCCAVEKWLTDIAEKRDVQDNLRTLFVLESYTDDPRAYKIALGSVNLQWEKHSIKNLYINLPKGEDSRKK